MTKRIFRAVLAVAAAVLLACTVVIMALLCDYFTGVSRAQLRSQASLIAQAVNNEGAAYFDALDAGDFRVTWIAADGSVLFDTQTDAAAMENHADREEFIAAEENGAGESTRYSATLAERMLYSAVRLDDGSVVRVASAQKSALSLALGMAQPAIVILAAAIALSAVLASRLSKRIVKPLNELNLDAPLENDTYEELAPLLARIEEQHRKIAAQTERLRRSREEWDAVAGSLNEGIVLLGEKGVVLSVNRSAAKLLGAGENSVGRDFIEVCRRLDVQELLERAAAGEKAEIVAQFDAREFQVDASPIMSDGGVKGTALLFFDVTDKARAEQMRREFTANVSHELKTPLHTISGSAEIIKNGLVAPEDMPRFIDRIYTESRRMITLVDDIIRLSGLDEGAENTPREAVSLKAAAEDAVKRLAPQAEEKGVTVGVSGECGEIFAVAPLIAEMVYNLCDNAIKYNREGGSVAVTVAETADTASLTVADTGIGIPAEAQGRVFERFYRVDKSHSKEIGGTGLGLSIVKHVAQMHGAQLELSSRINEGTSIKATFPKAAAPHNPH